MLLQFQKSEDINRGADKALPFTPGVGRSGNKHSRVLSPGGQAAVDTSWLPWEPCAERMGWEAGSWTEGGVLAGVDGTNLCGRDLPG